jgi:ankyrin repeat protein
VKLNIIVTYLPSIIPIMAPKYSYLFGFSLMCVAPFIGVATPDDPDAIIDATTGNTTLILAAGTADSDSAEVEILAGANVDIQNKKGETALHAALYGNNATIAESILWGSPTLDLLDTAKNTPLFFGVKQNATEAVEVLVQNGANTTIAGLNGTQPFTPAGYAAAAGYLPILELLVPNSSVAALNATIGGMQPIHWAALNAKNDTLGHLVTNGANVTARVLTGSVHKDATPLLLAIFSNSTDCVETLLNNGATIESGSVNGTKTNPLQLSLDKGYTDITDLLISANASLLTAPINSDGYSPLGYATLVGSNADNATIVYLIGAGAPWDQTINNNTKAVGYNLTAAHLAAYLGKTDLLAAIVDGKTAAEIHGLATGPAACYDVGLAAIAGNKNTTLNWLFTEKYKGGADNPNSWGAQNWTLCTDNANCTNSGTACTIKDYLSYAIARNKADTKKTNDKPNLATKDLAKAALLYLRKVSAQAKKDGY